MRPKQALRMQRMKLGGALFGVAPVLLIVAGPMLMQPNPRLLPARTPAAVGLAFDDVEFSPPDVPIKLRAWLSRVENAKATVVMVHGGGEDNRALPYGNGLELMRDLAVNGYRVLALDLRNYGESDASPEGRPSFGVREASDVIGALNHLDGRAPRSRYAALGFSMGGSTVLYAAARDRRLEAVVSDSAFADSSTVAGNFVRAAMGIPLWLSRPFLWSAETIHGMELGAGRPLDVVRQIPPRRLLLIHDRSDPIVPLEQARRLAAASQGAKLWITDTARIGDGPFGTHIQSYSRAPEAYIERVTEFFDETFAAPRRRL